MNSKSNGLELVQAPATPYDQALRAVGQGLECLGIMDFDLEVEGNGYFVLGEADEQPGQQDPGQAAHRSTFQDVWQKLALRAPISNAAAKSASTSEKLRVLFTPEGIDRLQHEGTVARRSDSPGIPDPNRLSQVLRMVGEHINRKSGRLLKIYRRKDWLAFEYQTVLGSKIMEKWRVSDLYDFWLLLSNERKDPYEMAERVLDRECERA